MENLKPPGDCTQQEWYQLQQAVKNAKRATQGKGCYPGMDRETAQANAALWDTEAAEAEMPSIIDVLEVVIEDIELQQIMHVVRLKNVEILLPNVEYKLIFINIMEQNTINIEHLKNQINCAFDNVKFPGDDNLLHPSCFDESEIQDFLNRNWSNWHEIEEEIIPHNYSSLVFLTPKAFCFFLPAYMLYGLNHPLSNVLEFTVYSLILRHDPQDPMILELCLSWFNNLNEAQKDTVTLFLKYIKKTPSYFLVDSATEALNSYWDAVSPIASAIAL